MLFVVAVWGTTFVLVKGALDDATPLAFNLIRMTLAFLAMAALGGSALVLVGPLTRVTNRPAIALAR